MKNYKEQRGVTLVELIVVITLVAILAFALFPLIETTYNSWRTADRRVKLLQTGRVGMDKAVRELRKACDLAYASDSVNIEFYPDWASDTVYRLDYDTVPDLTFGATASPLFDNDLLAQPLDTYEYLTYNRRVETGVTRYRQVNAFRFVFKVSDERRVLPQNTNSINLNPMSFRSHVQMRTSREGWMISRSTGTTGFASDTYQFDRDNNDQVCVKIFCDRVNRNDIATATLEIVWKTGEVEPHKSLTWEENGDYWWGCAKTDDDDIEGGGGQGSRDTVIITIRDNDGEECYIEDSIYVQD